MKEPYASGGGVLASLEDSAGAAYDGDLLSFEGCRAFCVADRYEGSRSEMWEEMPWLRSLGARSAVCVDYRYCPFGKRTWSLALACCAGRR